MLTPKKNLQDLTDQERQEAAIGALLVVSAKPLIASLDAPGGMHHLVTQAPTSVLADSLVGLRKKNV